MGGEADAAFGRIERQTALHQAGQEAVGFGLARPAALVEAAQHERVDTLQAGFEGAPDRDPAVGARRRLYDLRRDQGGEHVGPFVGGKFEPRFGGEQ